MIVHSGSRWIQTPVFKWLMIMALSFLPFTHGKMSSMETIWLANCWDSLNLRENQTVFQGSIAVQPSCQSYKSGQNPTTKNEQIEKSTDYTLSDFIRLYLTPSDSILLGWVWEENEKHKLKYGFLISSMRILKQIYKHQNSSEKFSPRTTVVRLTRATVITKNINFQMKDTNSQWKSHKKYDELTKIRD